LSDSYVSTITFPPGGLADEVMRRGDYVVSHDRAGSEFPLSPAARAEGIHSIMCLPLASANQRLGVIYFYRDAPEDFTFEEIELIGTFSHLAAHAIRNARLHETTVDLAETDSLTGLANRRKLEQRLHQEIARAQRNNRPLALVLLDVDHFKGINDSHGHAAGDAVLRALAEVFRHEVRDVDLAARTGGEEFMFLLPETDGERALRVAERIRAALHAQPISVPGAGRLQVTVSLGIACYPRDASAADALIANADRALYLAKQAGRDRVAVYSESTLH
jgi:diguanylate cyclase (GGDEF)-like protein